MKAEAFWYGDRIVSRTRGVTLYPSRIIPKLTKEIPAWIDQWQFSRFVTLATNNAALATDSTSALPYARLRDRLREFDGRMNRKLLGTKWAIRHSDRMWAFWFLEKPNANPHWHGLVRFFPADGRPIPEQEAKFDLEAENVWRKLVPAGSVNVQEILVQRGVVDYVCKMIGYPISYEHFTTPDEFVRG